MYKIILDGSFHSYLDDFRLFAGNQWVGFVLASSCFGPLSDFGWGCKKE